MKINRGVILAAEAISLTACLIAYHLDKWSKSLDQKADEDGTPVRFDYFEVERATSATSSIGSGRIRTHLPSACAGHACTLHNPSKHELSERPLRWRIDLQVMERQCECGNWHPDPDDVVYQAETMGRVLSHPCPCECCGNRLSLVACAHCNWIGTFDHTQDTPATVGLRHVEEAHPDLMDEVERWPDGEPVVDESAIADREFE